MFNVGSLQSPDGEQTHLQYLRLINCSLKWAQKYANNVVFQKTRKAGK